MDTTLVPDRCSLAPEQGLSNSCPSSEWESIREFLALASYGLPEKYEEIYGGDYDLNYFLASGKASQRQQYLAQAVGPNALVAPLASTTQMVATADALTTTSALWFSSLFNVTQDSGHGSPLSIQSDSTHTLSGDSLQGFTEGNCFSEAVQNTTGTNPLAFPFLYFANNPATPTINITSSNNNTLTAIVHPSLSRADVLKNAKHPFEYQLHWVDLPQPLFNGSSIGAIIVPPQAVNSTSDSDGPHNLTLCNLAAGWGTTALKSERDEYTGGSVSSIITKYAAPQLAADATDGYNPTTETINAELEFNYPGYPQRFINITQEWAQYLDPMVESANRSVFDLFMQERPPVQGSLGIDAFNVFVAGTLVLMVTNGLARIGYESTLQGSPKSIPGTPFIDGNYWLSGKGNVFTVDPIESKDWVKFHVNSTLLGYAYNTQTLPPRLAIGVMTLYCIIALAHVVYSGITGRFPPVSDTSEIFPIF